MKQKLRWCFHLYCYILLSVTASGLRKRGWAGFQPLGTELDFWKPGHWTISKGPPLCQFPADMPFERERKVADFKDYIAHEKYNDQHK